uniref:Cytochrome b5 heme-binding domain-containing protein n=1 Tax=Parastrongyloides trichosuri TaxID=131310 RepID=A0A0N4Z0C4_PARTI
MEEKPLFLSLNGRYYDVREFASKHPGGKKVLEKLAGGEIDRYMKGQERIFGVKHEHSEAAYKMLETYSVDRKQENDPFLEKGKAILSDIGKLGENYIQWIHEPYDGTLRLFESDFLERLTRTPWYIVPLVWMPVVLIFGIQGLMLMTEKHGLIMGLIYTFILCIAGVLAWTLLEYVLHRYVFHWEPNLKSENQILFHFLAHGLHHKTPFDGDRLVFPPTPALFIIGFFYFVYSSILPWDIFCCFAAAKLCSYIGYDVIHYWLHHAQFKCNSIAHYRKVYHHNHHFKDFDAGFGITTNLWDYVFGTVGSGPI